jgi:hypothetical protein
MKLITKEIEKALLSHPLYSQEGNPNPKVVAKFFNPCGAGSWYITEGEKQADGDWLLFGLCHIYDAELGYVTLSELESLQLPFGLTIERDMYWSGTLNDAYKDLGIDTSKTDEEIGEDVFNEVLNM